MSSEDAETQGVEDSVDSSSSASLSANNNNKTNNNNNVLKMGPLFLTQSAELYYKQLIAANVAALTKPRLAASVRTTLAKTALDQVPETSASRNLIYCNHFTSSLWSLWRYI